MGILLALLIVGGATADEQPAPVDCTGAVVGGAFVGGMGGAAAGVAVDFAGYFVSVELLHRDSYCGSIDAPLLGAVFYAPVAACCAGIPGAIAGGMIAHGVCSEAPSSRPSSSMKH